MSTFPELIFPPIDARTELTGSVERIYDVVRRTYVALTPEEWVRQHCIHWLMSQGYPLGRCSVERAISVSGTTMRYDVVWMDDQLRPYLLIECKAPTTPVTAAVVEQSAWYNHTLHAPFLLITNGRTAHCYSCKPDGSFTVMTDVPPYPQHSP